MPTPNPEDWREKWESLRKDAQGNVIVPTQDAITAELDTLDAICHEIPDETPVACSECGDEAYITVYADRNGSNPTPLCATCFAAHDHEPSDHEQANRAGVEGGIGYREEDTLSYREQLKDAGRR